MTRGLLIGASLSTTGARLVADTAQLLVDELVGRAEDASGPIDFLFGTPDQATQGQSGGIFVPIDASGVAAAPYSMASGPLRTICLHGPESTGKSVLAERLAEKFGTAWVPEYGRAHCEVHGTELDEAGLLLIGRVQDAMIRASRRWARDRLFIDTDPLMTAAWCEMMLGYMPAPLFAYAKADLYLMMEPDVAWQGDRVRIYGDDRERGRFAAICREVLERAGVNWIAISGDWQSRFDQAVAAAEDLNVRLGGSAGL